LTFPPGPFNALPSIPTSSLDVFDAQIELTDQLDEELELLKELFVECIEDAFEKYDMSMEAFRMGLSCREPKPITLEALKEMTLAGIFDAWEYSHTYKENLDPWLTHQVKADEKKWNQLFQSLIQSKE
jgi:hypothetical protein